MSARPEVREYAAGTAVAVSEGDQSFKGYLQRIAPELEKVLPTIRRIDDLISAALIAQVRNPEILKCSKESTFLALMKCARLGLDIGDDIHLVPLKGKLEAWPDYKGLIRLAREAHIVRDMVPYPVYKGDDYSFHLGLNEDLRHVPVAAERRGPLVAAWCRIALPRGRVTFHQMPIEDIEARRKQSRTWASAPTCPPWYAMKTVIRDWLNRQPKGKASPQLAEALAGGDDLEEPAGLPLGVTADGEVVAAE